MTNQDGDDTSRAAAILAELAGLGSEAGRAGQARFGINTARADGVSMATLRPIARRLKRDHGLAAALWASGRHEARILAGLIGEPKRLTSEEMDAWTAEFDSWDLCDQVCSKLFVRTRFVEEKVWLWVADEREFVRRAGFALLAAYAVHAKKVPDDRFLPFLCPIGDLASDPRNFVKKAVNWALRQIGKRSAALHAPALALARRLAESSDRTRRWVGRDAVKELTDARQLGRLGLV